jgi:hypothetical protein
VGSARRKPNKMRYRGIILLVFTISAAFLLVSCATQPTTKDAYDPPGFFMGLHHGFIAVFALIGHLFDDGIRVYAFPNSGGWYDFGFCIGIGAFSGGAASSSV